MIHSLIAHGAQGYFAGWTGKKRILGLTLASIIMVGWYVVGSVVLGQGLGAALASVWGNLTQNFFGMLVGYLTYRVVTRKG